MDKINYILLAIVFLISVVGGFQLMNAKLDQVEEEYTKFEINSSEQIKELQFFNHSVNLMLEDSVNAKFYIDEDMDQAADRKLLLRSGGQIRNSKELIDFEDSTYVINMVFHDDPKANGDAWLKVTSVQRLG